MTIREHYRRVWNRIMFGDLGVATMLCAFVAVYYPHLTRLQSAEVSVLLVVPMIVLVKVLVRRKFRCPRCGADLLKLRRGDRRRSAADRQMFDRRMFWEAWNACPRCEIGFDEPFVPVGAPNYVAHVVPASIFEMARLVPAANDAALPTVRQWIARRILIAFVGAAVIFPGVFVSRYLFINDRDIRAYMAFAPLLATVAWLYLSSRLRCPHCQRMLGYQFGSRAIGIRPAHVPPQDFQQPEVCPHCQTRLDSPMP
jgi:hypothetical protein